jgi:hypothetical protein
MASRRETVRRARSFLPLGSFNANRSLATHLRSDDTGA